MALFADIPARTTEVPGAVAGDVQFTVGTLVSSTFSIWWRNLGRFSLLTLAVFAPLIALVFGMTFVPRADAGPGGPLVLVPFLVILVVLPLALVQMVGITYGSVEALAGRPVRLRELLGAGLRRGAAAFGAGLVAYSLVLLGLFLLVVPGIVAAMGVSVTVPASVMERNGALGAVKRSFALTKGRRLALLAAYLVVGLVSMALTATAALLNALGAASRHGAILLVGGVATIVVNLAVGSLPAIASAVAYHLLRLEKEGVDTATLAKVFE